MTESQALSEKVARLWPHLDERARRLFAASEARQLGHGGVSLVSRACGLSRVTITKGLQELDDVPLPVGRVRRPGAGRPLLEVSDPALPDRLDALVEPLARGDPDSPLRWTTKSTRVLAATLAAEGHPISHERVAQMLRQLQYSLQGTARPKRAPITRTGTRSFGTSATKCARRSPRNARSFRWIRRRRNCSGTTRTRASSGCRRSGPRGSRGTTSRIRRAARVSVRHLRPGAQHRLRERRDRPRHRRVRRGVHSRVVARGRAPAVSERADLLITADGGGSNG